MKRLCSVFLLLILLAGCAPADKYMERAASLREKFVTLDSAFTLHIHANGASSISAFSLDCKTQEEGKVVFEVLAPEAISGVTGELSAVGGALTFDEMAVSFPMLAEGRVSPVSLPWLLTNTLRSGYLSTCGKDGEHLRLTIYDSYADNALQMDIWIDEEETPRQVEVIWKNRMILSATIENFRFL